MTSIIKFTARNTKKKSSVCGFCLLSEERMMGSIFSFVSKLLLVFALLIPIIFLSTVELVYQEVAVLCTD